MATEPRPAKVASARALLNGPRKAPEPTPIPHDEMSPQQLLNQPTATLSKILRTLDRFVDELNLRAEEGSITLKDFKALSDVVKAHSTLRQTQLAEDQFARQAHTMTSDADIALLLIEAVKAGGDSAQGALEAALQSLQNPNPKQLGPMAPPVPVPYQDDDE